MTAVLALGGAACTPPTSDASKPPISMDAARRQLDELTVATQASMRGYSRDRFPHWRTDNGCTTRETVLNRDGTNVVVGKDCEIVSGRWQSPYDNKTITSPSLMDIDHMVPLANAWRSGADLWTDDKRGDFANDLDTPQLIAVTASTNRAKGDQDPSLWRPPNRDYWCRYAQSWIAVKRHWQLTVTTAEKAALIDMLEKCLWSSGPPTSSRAPAG